MSASRIAPPDPASVADDVSRALAEDIGDDDATSALLPAGVRSTMQLSVREAAVLAGRDWFAGCFRALDPAVSLHWSAADGERVTAGSMLCRVTGDVRALLGAERSALNFLQTLSATATRTARYVEAVAGTRAVILDTRKTLPGLRQAQKYAVRCGGACNHRMGLFDAVLIKENHIVAAGGIAAAITAARRLRPGLPVEVEVESDAELEQALAAAPDRIMLDDFDLDGIAAAVRRVAGRVPLEASGGVDLARVRGIAETGVDFISIGALTKHVRAIDLSLRLLPPD
ncbi:MAG: carboxylating nicotinate-nucleotide diphosphorylase [Xanthomonadaceae bacterium]|nr:carboxylating nicotinate-nucleotide diphosphorylase [Xanthomonadaceae bacterium]